MNEEISFNNPTAEIQLMLIKKYYQLLIFYGLYK